MALNPNLIAKIALDFATMKITLGLVKPGDDVDEAFPHLHDVLVNAGVSQDAAFEFMADLQDTVNG
ncbi:MAG: hypothetical protein LCH93_01180 [Proteobacteria bacterium]|nr:hypothetical protein [Pseudomonadota bacterium]